MMPRRPQQQGLVLPARDLNYLFFHIFSTPGFSIEYDDFRYIITQLAIPGNRHQFVCDSRAAVILQYMLSAAVTFEDSSATAFFSVLHNDVIAYAASQYYPNPDVTAGLEVEERHDDVFVVPQNAREARVALADIIARKAKERAEAEAKAAAEKARLEQEAREKVEAEVRLEQEAREVERLAAVKDKLERREAGERSSIVHGEEGARASLEARKSRIPQPVRAAQQAWEAQRMREEKARLRAEAKAAAEEVTVVAPPVTATAAPAPAPAEVDKPRGKKVAKTKPKKSTAKPAAKQASREEVRKLSTYGALLETLASQLKQVRDNRDTVVVFAQTIRPDLESEDDGFASGFKAVKVAAKGQKKKAAKQQAKPVANDLLTQQLARLHKLVQTVDSHLGVIAAQTDDEQLKTAAIIRDARQEFLELLLNEQVCAALKNRVYQPAIKSISASLSGLITKSFGTSSMWLIHSAVVNLLYVYARLKTKLSLVEGLPGVQNGVRHLIQDDGFNLIMFSQFLDDTRAELLSNFMELFSEIAMARTDKIYIWVKARAESLINIAAISNVSISLRFVSDLFKFYQMGFIPNMQGNLKQLNEVYTTFVEQIEEVPASFIENITQLGDLITRCLGHMVWSLKHNVLQEFEFDLVLRYFILAQKLLAKSDSFKIPEQFVDHLGYILILNVQSCNAIKKFFVDRELTHSQQYNVFTQVIEGLLRQDIRHDATSSNANKALNIYARLSLMMWYVDDIFKSDITTLEQKQYTATLFKQFVFEILKPRMSCLDKLLKDALQDVEKGKGGEASSACKTIGILFDCISTELQDENIAKLIGDLQKYMIEPDKKSDSVSVIKIILKSFQEKVNECFERVAEKSVDKELADKLGDGHMPCCVRVTNNGEGDVLVMLRDLQLRGRGAAAASSVEGSADAKPGSSRLALD